MMRSPHTFAVACRAPNGEIVLQAEPLEKTWIGRQKWLMLPYLRGSWAILDAMTLGVRAMRFAAAVQTDDIYQPADEESPATPELAVPPADPVATGPVPFIAATPLSVPEEQAITGKSNSTSTEEGEEPGRKKRIQDIAIGGTIVFSLIFGFLLFNYLPNAVSTLVTGNKPGQDALTSLVTEIVKISLFLGYMVLISRLPEIQRVFMYHGAEHKAINALEAMHPLDVPHTRQATRFHPRCGTSFAAIVFIIGLIVFPFIPRPHTGRAIVDITLRFGVELIVLPFIAGAAYEALRFAGKFRNSAVVDTIFKPGIWTQRLTTKEPQDEQIEVALAALQACVDAERERSGTAPVQKAEGSESAVIN